MRPTPNEPVSGQPAPAPATDEAPRTRLRSPSPVPVTFPNLVDAVRRTRGPAAAAGRTPCRLRDAWRRGGALSSSGDRRPRLLLPRQSAHSSLAGGTQDLAPSGANRASVSFSGRERRACPPQSQAGAPLGPPGDARGVGRPKTDASRSCRTPRCTAAPRAAPARRLIFAATRALEDALPDLVLAGVRQPLRVVPPSARRAAGSGGALPRPAHADPVRGDRALARRGLPHHAAERHHARPRRL